MKNYPFSLSKTVIVRRYRFRRLFRGLPYGFLSLCMGLFLTSCATKGPQGTYLKNMSLSGISKVAIVASVNAPAVSYAKTDNVSANLFPFTGLFPIIVEAAIRSGVDRGHAGEVKKHMDFTHFEETVAKSFTQQLKKGDCFQTAEYLTDKNLDLQQLSTKGYDAVIRLFVHDISLKRVAGDNVVALDAYVRGQMEYFSSGKIVWDREEYVTSPEPRSLDYYKENGFKELDAMLEKAGRNLAYDFVYLK